MHLGDRILAVIADFDGDVINLLAAVVAIPGKVILFAAFALSFKDDKPGVLLNPRRVRHAARAKQHLAGFDDRGLLLAFAVDIDKILHAAQLQSDLIAGVDVEIFALLATAAEKRQRLGILPQDAPSFSFSLDFVNHSGEIDRNELFHEPTIALSKAQVQQDWAVLNEISRSFLRIKAVSKNLNAPFSASVNSRFLFGEIGSAQTFGLEGLLTRLAHWLEASFYEADTLSWYYDPTPLNSARV